MTLADLIPTIFGWAKSAALPWDSDTRAAVAGHLCDLYQHHPETWGQA